MKEKVSELKIASEVFEILHDIYGSRIIISFHSAVSESQVLDISFHFKVGMMYLLTLSYREGKMMLWLNHGITTMSNPSDWIQDLERIIHVTSSKNAMQLSLLFKNDSKLQIECGNWHEKVIELSKLAQN